jgi:class 3 adenylate cyclase
MTTSDKKIQGWLEHRAGLRELTSHPILAHRRALELNERGPDFTAFFGKRLIKGCVIFVDLQGFSTRVMNYSPPEISAYLQPFLSGVIEAGTKADGLVDKTLGDEVMLFLPDMEEDGGKSVVFDLRFLLSLLDQVQFRLGDDYPFHIGVSYGLLFIDRIEGKGYSEWTLAGGSVILAKRLTSLSNEPNVTTPFRGSFGALTNEVTEREFQSLLKWVAGELTPFDYQIIDNAKLKGVPSARCTAFERRPTR